MCHCPETNACVMHCFHSPTRHVMSLCDALRDNLRECESITFNKNRSSQREQTSTETEFLHSFKLRTTRLQNLVVSSVTRVPTFHRMSWKSAEYFCFHNPANKQWWKQSLGGDSKCCIECWRRCVLQNGNQFSNTAQVSHERFLLLLISWRTGWHDSRPVSQTSSHWYNTLTTLPPGFLLSSNTLT